MLLLASDILLDSLIKVLLTLKKKFQYQMLGLQRALIETFNLITNFDLDPYSNIKLFKLIMNFSPILNFANYSAIIFVSSIEINIKTIIPYSVK